jgi:XTP/dITP diphosphohydrolase
MRSEPSLASAAPRGRRSLKARLASTNLHKLTELRRALPDWEIEALADPLASPPAETAATFRGNARLKAVWGRANAAAADEWALGEDSGIEVAGLGGRPGIESARWATDGVARLLAELGDRDDRRARYVCALVAVAPDGRALAVEGVLAGTIATEPRGGEGFGYDPVFVPEGERLTVAELGDVWKSRHSHRARAAASLVQAIAG